MSTHFQLRPTFDLQAVDSAAAVIDRLAALQSVHSDRKLFAMYGEYGELHVPQAEHRFWSPYLSFAVSESEQGTIIHGRFAPRLEVWTLVWILYLAMGFAGFFGAMMACSQWMLSVPAWGAIIAVASCVGIGSLSLAARIGQGWSSDQMHDLRERLEKLMSEASVQVREATV
ncbi:MAG: hypothetical protein U0892_03385 [Pirellulales bacterium]